MSLFGTHSQSEQASSIAHFMPVGTVYSAANTPGTILRKYIYGLAFELYRVEATMNGIVDDHNVNNTLEFIANWENAVGIPDDCMDRSGNIQQRRNNVIAKLAKMNVVTAQDFIDLAALFGIRISIQTGTQVWAFPLTFPITLTNYKTMKFTMFVNFAQPNALVFPLPFPIQFSSGFTNIIQCLFNKLKPANVQVIYRYGIS